MKDFYFPLMSNNITREDINAVIRFLAQDTIPKLTNGPKVLEFESAWSKWLGVSKSLFVNSGSSANELTMLAIRELYGEGEVIVPPLTWVSDVASVLHAGMTPVFCDINLRNLSFDPHHLDELVNEKTRAIFVTHVLGLNAMTQQLLDFRHRHNLLLVEDVCLPKGEQIITNQGLKPVESVQKNDFVLTHSGKFQRVLSTMSRKFRGKIYSFYSYGSSAHLSTTDNHPIFCVKTNDILKDRQPIWTQAANIKIGDYLVFPRYKVEKDTDFIDLSHYDGACDNPKHTKIYEQRIKTKVPLNKSLMTIIGWYLAEGFVEKQHINFCLCANETVYIQELCQAITDLGFDFKLRQTKDSRVVNVLLLSKQMAQWLPENFGRYSYGKNIPNWIIDLPREKLKVLLDSYKNGDGCDIKNRINQRSITSVSLNLLIAIKIICSKLGYLAGITQTAKEGTSEILGRKIKIRNKYQLRYSESQNNPIDRRTFMDENYIFLRVRDVSVRDAEEEVFNFEVEHDNSYCGQSWLVHNCESHGATFDGQKAGTFGDVSNFSFYFAHHMSTIEGGMVCTNNSRLYEIMRCLRSHGMLRESTDPDFQRMILERHPELNKDFVFIAPAHNYRSTEINAVIGLNQLPRLHANNRIRSENFSYFIERLDSEKYFTEFDMDGQVNYAFIIIMKEPDFARRDSIERAFVNNSIEFRRGLSGGGSQAKQPYVRSRFTITKKTLPVMEHVHHFSWYVGNYPDLKKAQIDVLLDVLNSI